MSAGVLIMYTPLDCFLHNPMIFWKLQVRKHKRKKASTAHGAMIAVFLSCSAVGFSVADVTGCSEVLVTFGLLVEAVVVVEWVVVLGLVTGWFGVVIFDCEAWVVVITVGWVVSPLVGVVSVLTVVTFVPTWSGHIMPVGSST